MRLDILSPRLLPYVMTLGFLGAGALAGLVVATGNLVMIALVVGGLTGLLLLNALPLAVWILMVGVFLVNGPVGYFLPGLSKIVWLFSLLGVFMSGAALLYAAAGPRRPARPMPTFVVLALVFAVVAALGSIFSNGSMAEISSGFKRQFQFWGIVFLFALVPFSPAHVRRWLIFLLGVAVAQLPFALYQRLKLVPQVMGYEAPGFVPFDIVVGSFEGSMFGGGASAIMAMYLVLAVVALFCAYRERLIGGGRFLLLLILTALPLGLGETKVVLLLIPVVLLFAFHDAIVKRPLAFLAATLLMAAVVAFLAYLYFMVQVSGTTTWQDSFDATFAYNFGEKGYYGSGVNRLTAIPYWFESQSWAEPMRTLFGYGIGSSYGVDGRVPLRGHIFEAHSGMHIDLVTASLMLWDFGLVGTLLFFGILLSAVVAASRCLNEAVTPLDRTLCRLLLAGLGAALLMMLYSASIVTLVSHGFILALNLGLVAWRVRHGPLAGPGAATAAAFSPGPLGGRGGRFAQPSFDFGGGAFAAQGGAARHAASFTGQPAPAGAAAADTGNTDRPAREFPGYRPWKPVDRTGPHESHAASFPGANPGIHPGADVETRPGDLPGSGAGTNRGTRPGVNPGIFPEAPPREYRRRAGQAAPAPRDSRGRIEPVIDLGPSTSRR